MESIVGGVAVFFIAIFLYSFLNTFDLLSIIVGFTIPQTVIIKTRWVLGGMALVATAIYIIIRLKN